MLSFGQWRYTVDRDATEAAYSRATQGDAQRCGCSHCRNFVAVRDLALPRQFRDLLVTLGIDASKEGEVYHEGRLGPGKHCYGGWYHFVGKRLSAGDFAPIEYPGGDIAYMSTAGAPHLSSFDGLPLVQVEFRLQNVPWAIAEEEPE